MEQMQLVLAADRGLYTTNDPANQDLTSQNVFNAGTALEVLLGGHWHRGTIWYDPEPIYTQLGPQRFGDNPRGPDAIGGYYFESEDGKTRCGLCVGMTVRYPAERPRG